MGDTAQVSGVRFFFVSLSAVYLQYVTDLQVYTRTPDTCAVWRIDPFCWAKNRTLFAGPLNRPFLLSHTVNTHTIDFGGSANNRAAEIFYLNRDGASKDVKITTSAGHILVAQWSSSTVVSTD